METKSKPKAQGEMTPAVRSCDLLGALRHSAEAHRRILNVLVKYRRWDAEEQTALKARTDAISDLLEIIDATEKRLAPNDRS